MNWRILLPEFKQLDNLQFSGSIGGGAGSRLAGMGEIGNPNLCFYQEWIGGLVCSIIQTILRTYIIE